ncbi:hypothetical protein ACIQXV_17240 [Neobacillus sp. NPDC097160]|uniref:hypothetical protein n=1 Tax=Neobacillus sp. NPDC097160 TaxID=3364298 RepID=UPI0037FEC7D4
MTVLFGSVEYYERELLHEAKQNHVNKQADDQISMTYSRLKSELLNDFVCEERIRVECLENLKQAFCRLFKPSIRATAQ